MNRSPSKYRWEWDAWVTWTSFSSHGSENDIQVSGRDSQEPWLLRFSGFHVYLESRSFHSPGQLQLILQGTSHPCPDLGMEVRHRAGTSCSPRPLCRSAPVPALLITSRWLGPTTVLPWHPLPAPRREHLVTWRFPSTGNLPNRTSHLIFLPRACSHVLLLSSLVHILFMCFSFPFRKESWSWFWHWKVFTFPTQL